MSRTERLEMDLPEDAADDLRALAEAEALHLGPFLEAMIRGELRALRHEHAPPELRVRYERARAEIREAKAAWRGEGIRPRPEKPKGRFAELSARNAEIRRLHFEERWPKGKLVRRYRIGLNRISEILRGMGS